MEGALLRYRIMSFVTGTALLLLFVVAHGVVLYPLYLLTVVQLWFLTRLRWWWWLLMLVAGVIPFLAFVMEHYVTRAIRAGEATPRVPPAGRRT